MTTKAKRGDLAAIVETRTDYFIGQASKERTTITLGIVTSVTREGLIKALQVPFSSDDHGARAPYHVTPYIQTLLVPAAAVDVAGVMAAYRQHTYAGHTQIEPFESVDAARAFVAPFRIDQTTQTAA